MSYGCIELLLCDICWSGKMDNPAWLWNEGCWKINGVPVITLGLYTIRFYFYCSLHCNSDSVRQKCAKLTTNE